MSTLPYLLEYVTKHIPRYKGLKPSLEFFPVLNKQSITADLTAHLSDDLGTDKPGLLEQLNNDRPIEYGWQEYIYGSKYYIEQTSGSSGIPFRLLKTFEERAQMVFNLWQYRRKFDALFTPGRFYPFDHTPVNFISVGDASNYSQQNIDILYNTLSTIGIRWVHARVWTLRAHAEAISPAIARNKSVCIAENTGYALSPADRQLIAEKLNVTVIDQYGCREVMAIGYRADDGPFAVLSANILVEILDDNNQPITEADAEGRIVVTSLHQYKFPFIRFCLGDMGAWAKGGVGKHLRLAEHRPHNWLQFDGKKINGNEFFKTVLNTVYKDTGFTNLEYIQIRQTGPNQFILALSRSPRASMLCHAIEGYLDTRYANKVTFSLYELSDAELSAALLEKPSLFTTKYLSQPN